MNSILENFNLYTSTALSMARLALPLIKDEAERKKVELYLFLLESGTDEMSKRIAADIEAIQDVSKIDMDALFTESYDDAIAKIRAEQAPETPA